MYFNQISVDGMGCLSYVIGCPRAKAMAVVDPKRQVILYIIERLMIMNLSFFIHD
jgi:hypothetical protein